MLLNDESACVKFSLRFLFVFSIFLYVTLSGVNDRGIIKHKHIQIAIYQSLYYSMNVTQKSKENFYRCKICIGPAIHSNYGVMSCPPCKMFFKRNALRGQVCFVNKVKFNFCFFVSLFI
jgi:hypothetical protein